MSETETLRAEVRALQARLTRLEDLEALKVLQRSYGYFLDKGLWRELADLFDEDGRIEIGGRGVYVGRDRIFRFMRDVMGEGVDGLAPGRLLNHMQLQGVLTLEPGATTAHGRWRAFIQSARFGTAAEWAEGVYENDYIQRDGVWRVASLHWYATYYTPYDKGFGVEAKGLSQISAEFPPDAPPSESYDPFPGYHVPPFHYLHPVTARPIDGKARI